MNSSSLDSLSFLEEFDVSHGVEFFSAKSLSHYSPSSRVIKRVFIGNLCMARSMASRARGSATPPISNMTRPGLTFAIQVSTGPYRNSIRRPRAFCAGDLGKY